MADSITSLAEVVALLPEGYDTDKLTDERILAVMEAAHVNFMDSAHPKDVVASDARDVEIETLMAAHMCRFRLSSLGASGDSVTERIKTLYEEMLQSKKDGEPAGMTTNYMLPVGPRGREDEKKPHYPIVKEPRPTYDHYKRTDGSAIDSDDNDVTPPGRWNP